MNHATQGITHQIGLEAVSICLECEQRDPRFARVPGSHDYRGVHHGQHEIVACEHPDHAMDELIVNA